MRLFPHPGGDRAPGDEALIPKHGGYRNLKSFQIAQLVYDVTVRFCDRYVPRRSRTWDQMEQAARSGVQNLAEGSLTSATSKKSELRLTGVARASLEELGLDYRDFLRHRGLPRWPPDDPRRQELIDRRCRTAEEVAAWVHEVHERERGRGEEGGESGRGRGGLCGQSGRSGQNAPGAGSTRTTPSTMSTQSTPSTPSTPSTQSTSTASPPFRPSTYPEIAANAALVLIAVACSLIDRQLKSQAESFLRHGGFTERLYQARTAARSRNRSEDRS